MKTELDTANKKNSSINPSKRRQALALRFLFHHQIAFQNLFLPTCTRRFFLTRYYQYAYCLTENGALFGGRSFGKSLNLNARIIRRGCIAKGVESLITSFRRTHIKDRLEDVISYMLNSSYLRSFLKGDANNTTKGSVTRTPIYMIRFKNGHNLVGISVGDDPNGVMIQGHHPVYRYGEEMQFYPQAAWLKFQETADPRGTVDYFVGCVNGKLDTPYRHMDGKIEKFKMHRFHVSRRLEPWFNQKTKRDRIEAFDSETSNDFLQQVDSEWGEPIVSLWSEADLRNAFDKSGLEEGGTYKQAMQVVSVAGRDYHPEYPEERHELLASLFSEIDFPGPDRTVIFGIDAGFTSPTMILPFIRDPKTLKWVLKTRIQLVDRMFPDRQAECIDYLATRYNAKWMALDCSSGEGKAIAGSLSNPANTMFSNKQYEERLIWVEFQKKTPIHYKPNDKGEFVPVEVPIKNFTTTVLQTMFARGEFSIAYDEELLTEFMAEGKRESRDGDPSDKIRTPAWVHIPEAARTFAYAVSVKFNPIEKPLRLEEFQYGDSFLPEIGQGLGISIFGRPA